MWRFVLFMVITVAVVALLTFLLSDRAAHLDSQAEGPHEIASGPQRSAPMDLPRGELLASPQASDESAVGGIDSDASSHWNAQISALDSEKNNVFATPPVPFDPVTFAANPDSYLSQVVPARIFQSAQPGIEVPQLAAVAALRQSVALGDGAELRVRTVPLAPVTWCSANGGTFPNGKSTMSVRANDHGIASIRYAPSKGTYHSARVVAASPMSSGQVGFTLTILRPETAALLRD